MAENNGIIPKDEGFSQLYEQFKSLDATNIKWWVITILAVLFLGVTVILWNISAEYYVLKKALILVSIFTGAITAALIHIKWDNKIGTCIIGVGIIIIVLLATNAISLENLSEEIIEITKGKFK